MKKILTLITVSIMSFSCSCGCFSGEAEPQKKVYVKVKTVDGQWSKAPLIWTIPQETTLFIDQDKGSYWLAYRRKGFSHGSRLRNAVIDFKITKTIKDIQDEKLIK